MKKQFLLLVALFSLYHLSGQNISITGKTVDFTSKESVIAAKIILQKSDSVQVNAVTSDEKGFFTLSNIVPGDYRLAISSIGMQTSYIELKGLNAGLNLGEIALQEAINELKGIEVNRKSVINQSDRKLYFINELQRKNASNGMNLIEQLHIPKLVMDPLSNTIISVDRKNIQFRINDVPAEREDIIAIHPKDILRVEYIDNPGLRYGTEAGYVINFILIQRTSGGSAGVDLNHSINRGFINDEVNFKIHDKKSEYSFNYYFGYRHLYGLKRTNVETFRFENGAERVREEIGIPSQFKEIRHNGTLNYNYTDADKRVFNAKIKFYGYGQPNMDFISQSFWREKPGVLIDMQDLNGNYSKTPSIDLYYLEKLKNNQTLIFDLYYSKRLSDITRTYSERLNNVFLTDINSKVHGNRDTYIGEILYEKKFKTTKLTAGFKHQQSYTANLYTGNVTMETNMREANSYLYSEFSGSIKKMDYMAGLGINRVSVLQRDENGNKLTNIFFQPRARVRYHFNDASYIGINSRFYNETPSLSQLSNVNQLVDSLQIQRGNPKLKSWISSYSEINYSYSSKIIDVNTQVSYTNSFKPVMEETLRENGKFIRTFDNQKYWGVLNSELSLGIRPFKEYVVIQLTGGYYNFDSKGSNYEHHYNDFYHTEQINFMYKGFVLTFMNQKAAHWFFGETADAMESVHLVNLMYSNDKMDIGCAVLNPFTKTYKRDTENFSAYAPHEREWYSNKVRGLILLKFAYNMRWGKEHAVSGKRINNTDNDSGILQGGK